MAVIGSTEWRQEQNAKNAKATSGTSGVTNAAKGTFGGESSEKNTSTPSGGYTKYTGGNAALDNSLKQYQDAYSSSRVNGDWQGMNTANERANQLRNQYGYAAESAYDDINRIRGQNGGGTDFSNSGVTQTQTSPQYPYQFSSLEDMKAALGYDQVSAAEQQAIDAYIQKQVNSLNGQKAGVRQSAEEAARQAYVSYMQSKNILPQALSASGYSGGMADSQALALDTNLQNHQQTILQNRDSTLNDIETAINNARLEGSIQEAQAQSNLGRDAISAFQNYINQQNAYENQDFWSKYGYDYQGGQAQAGRNFKADQAQIDRDWQSGQAQADRDQSATVTTQAQAYDNAWNLILAGVMPSADLLTAAQISTADAQAYVAKVQAQNAANGKNTDRSSNGGSYSNSGGGSGGTQHVGGSAAELPTADGGGKSAGYQQTYEAMGKAAYNIGRSQGAEAEANWIADYLDGQYDKGVITQAEQEELAQIAAKMLKLI